jgi:hemin uptake protein HemP
MSADVWNEAPSPTDTPLNAYMPRKTHKDTLSLRGTEPKLDQSSLKAPDAAVKPGGILRLNVSELMHGEREAILEHRGQDYRLRITATGKLILTK